MDDKWEFYKDYAKEWRWRRKNANGKIIGASPRGYKNRQECLENAKQHGFV
ncbi:YegP family protein [Halodesulfovibrio marinisediminis]|uniref:DUF1508 domain-containing protein n=1 Tax=Halodesulfovibrio marinisediminis DSM 17456 TaxID=1121457 RepID=A0A1N6F4B3_9BACT|nr:DUF1508 domain-containing protein [Halodesulfovibrio marinisediminis]SIN90122.1 protein of unknown function [Halodesulfovibrio marinisediminis DSM 17456]